MDTSGGAIPRLTEEDIKRIVDAVVERLQPLLESGGQNVAPSSTGVTEGSVGGVPVIRDNSA